MGGAMALLVARLLLLPSPALCRGTAARSGWAAAARTLSRACPLAHAAPRAGEGGGGERGGGGGGERGERGEGGLPSGLGGQGEGRGAAARQSSAGGARAAPPPRRRALGERLKKTVAYRQEYRCAGCRVLLPPTFEVDHVVPLALGGHEGMANLQALCRACHAQKTRDQRHIILDARKSGRESRSSRAHKVEQRGTRADGNQRRGQKRIDGVVPGERASGMDTTAGGEQLRGRRTFEGAEHTSPGAMHCAVKRSEYGEEEKASLDGTIGRGEALPGAVNLGHACKVEGAQGEPTGPTTDLFQLLAGLNAQQLSAATFTAGHVRLAAGPGTGARQQSQWPAGAIDATLRPQPLVPGRSRTSCCRVQARPAC